MMPQQKPGKSKQDYRTPPEFLDAVKHRLHIYGFLHDLAATYDNAVCSACFTPEDNSLTQNWTRLRYSDDPHPWCWLNPPYADIEPWVAKAASESKLGAHIAMLVPASVGANWWRDYVEHDSYQLFLNGRIKFVGCKDYYPKDCALLLYTPFIRSGSAVWDWRVDATKVAA
jgi:phage N-6-adenine-methyltransferase